jgi:hypothetical protein
LECPVKGLTDGVCGYAIVVDKFPCTLLSPIFFRKGPKK